MSDGADPRHGPYRGKVEINLEEWAHELTYALLKIGAFGKDAPVVRITKEIQGFAEQVVRATRNGHFNEVT